MHLDFLIVAALKDEAKEIRTLLSDVRQEADLYVGSIKRWKGHGIYSVGLLDLFGMGTNNAQTPTQDAIGRYRPRAVLMTGIAAGLADGFAGVALGDLMVPYGIVPYELSKIRASSSGAIRRVINAVLHYLGLCKDSGVEHRGIAWSVAEGLWRTAANTATDVDQPWLNHVSAPRPDKRTTAPRIHARVDGIIGSGEKVIASADSEARKWLLAAYPRQALGLEMESFGVFYACRNFDTPFLTAKASVDGATIKKDDRWRTYACQLSAAFLVTVIQRYDRPVSSDFENRYNKWFLARKAMLAALPETDYQYKARTADNYSQLRAKQFNLNDVDIMALLPNEVHRVVAIHAGGGCGKSTVARRLFCASVSDDRLAVLLDLRLFSGGDSTADPEGGEGAEVGRIIKATSIPSCTAEEIEQIASQVQLTLIIDGTNEAPKNTLTALDAFARRILERFRCLVAWTGRMSEFVKMPLGTLYATLDHVPEDIAKQCFDGQFSVGKFATLTPRVRAIMLRPFFLNLAVRTGREFSGNRLWSGVFAEFFREHVTLTESEVNLLALATLSNISSDGKLNTNALMDQLNELVKEKLKVAQVRVFEAGDFGHHLWRDYLIARAISLDPTTWTDETFDAATTFGTSTESLAMAVEQITSPDDKVHFVKTVYDWNYVSALECIARSEPEDEPEARVPDDLRQAILAIVAEKRFDPVPRTADRTQRVLSQYQFAKDYLDFADREAMSVRASQIVGDASWLQRWRALYTKAANETITQPEVESVGSDDSLVGWTAANLARRGQLSDELQGMIRQMYQNHNAASGRRSIRWRVVHVLGKWPGRDNIELLARALKSDQHHWVSYGAARSLVEIAARSSGTDRSSAIQALLEFISDDSIGALFARDIILEEIVEVCFLEDARPDWTDDAKTLMKAACDAASLERRAALIMRIRKFGEGA